LTYVSTSGFLRPLVFEERFNSWPLLSRACKDCFSCYGTMLVPPPLGPQRSRLGTNPFRYERHMSRVWAWWKDL